MPANRVTLTITLDAQQAKDEIQRLKDMSDQLKDALKDVQDRIADPSKWLPTDTAKNLKKQEKQLTNQIKQLKKQISDGEYMLDGVEERLKKMSDYSYNNLKKLENVVKNALKNAQFNTDSYREAAAWLQQVNDEMAKRKMDINNPETIADAKKVLKKPEKYSTGEIENAIKTLKDLQAITAHNKKAWDRLEEAIQRGKDQLQKWNDVARESKANDRQANLAKLSTDALAEQKKYWKEMVDGAEQGSNALTTYQQKLKEVVDEEIRRIQAQAGSVMAKPADYSVKEIQDAIKATEQLRDAQKLGDPEWTKFNNQLENAKKYLQDYQNRLKQGNMEDQLKNVASLSQKALEEQQKYWKEMSDNEADPAKLQTYLGYLKQVNDELQNRSKIQSEAVMKNLQGSTVKEIQDAIKATEQLRDAQKLGSAEWTTYNDNIENAKKYLQDYQNQLKEGKMTDQLQSVASLSQKALEEQQKYWKEMSDNEADPTKLQTYLGYLKQVNDELQNRSKIQSEAVMKNLQGSTVKEIQDAIKATEQLRDAEQYRSAEWVTYTKQIKEATEYLKTYEAVAKMDEMEKQWHNLASLSKNALDEQKKYWQEMADNTGGPQELKAYLAMLEKVNKELENRNILSADKVMSNLGGSSVKEIEDAIKLTEQLRDAQQRNSFEWEYFNTQIEDATAHLKKYDEAMKRTAMSDQFKQLMQLSQKALEEQRKYWQQEISNAANNDPMLKTYTANLKAVNKELERRTALQTKDVLKFPYNYSVKEVEDAIKATEQLRDAQSRGSVQWNTYNAQIENAKKYLKDYEDLAMQSKMEVQMLNVTKLSQKALEEQQKFWKEVVSGSEATNPNLSKYVDLLKKANEEMDRRDEAKAKDVMSDISKRGSKEIEDAIKLMERLRDQEPFNSSEWEDYNKEIERAKNTLKGYENTLKELSMKQRLYNITDASTASLAEQKKYWQEMVNGAEQGNHLLPQYIANLQKVNDEEERRITNNAQDIMARTKTGWDDTIKATDEAVKQLKEYRALLNISDTTAIEQVDEAITILTGKIEQSKEGYMSLQDALTASSEHSMTNFSGTIDELEKLKKALTELRKTAVKAGDEQGLGEIDSSLARVNDKLAEATGNIRNFDAFMVNLNSKSLAELEAAAKQLSERLKNTAADTEEFARRSADLRDVNSRIQEITGSFRQQENAISRTAKRLAAYLAASFTINEIVSLTKRAIQANIELSDSFADIRKTTGLTEDAVRRLSNRIADIDTRTSMEDLHQLAVVAGQIGLRSSNDILGFVKASNQINVALNELGAEGTSTLMKLAQLTGDVNMGVEKSLLSIGSAINELSANSAATASPIVDMMSRLGGIAKQSGITTAEMAALGATFDALNQPIEMAGTSLNKFISTLVSDTEGVAYALNMDARVLKQLIQTGQTTEAMLTVFERMKATSKESTDGLAGLYNVMGDLGSEGARMSQILSSAAGSVEFMRAQVELSREAFEEATSVTNEYNVKNENAMAILQRTGNMIKEIFVNGGAESGITKVMRALHNFTKTIIYGGENAGWFKAILVATLAVMYTFSKGAINMANSVMRYYNNAKGATVATRLWKASLDMLKVSLKAIGVYAIAAGVGMLIGYVIDLVTHTDRLSKAIAENNNELAVQSNRLAFIRSELAKENLEEKKKLEYINELNKNYGQYLGFMLKHTDSTQKLMKATALLNAELRKQSALTIQQTIQDRLKEKQADQIQEVMTFVSDIAKDQSTYEEKLTPALAALVQNVVDMQMKEPLDNLVDVVKQKLKELEPERDIEHSYLYVANVVKAIKKLEKINREYNTEFESYLAMSNVQLEEAAKDSAKARIELLDEMRTEYEQLQSISTEGMDENAQRDHYNRLLELQQQYVKQSEEQMKNLNEQSAQIDATRATEEERARLDQLQAQKDALIEQTKAVTAYSDEIKKKLAVLNDHWGKGPNLAQWRQALDEIASGADLSSESIDKMVNIYKQIQKESQKISDVNAYNEMFGTNFTDLTKAQLDIRERAKTIKDRLAAIGRGVNGDFLWGSDGSARDAKRKAKEEYQAALAAFEAYWNERETILRKKSAEQQDTEAELNHKLELLNEEHWADQEQLYKKLLTKFYKESTFDPTKYEGPITGTKYFADKKLDELRVQLEEWGVAMEDGMQRKMTELGVKLQEQAHKVMREIEKILLDDDYNAQVMNQYMESLDRLGLLYGRRLGDETQRSRKENERRMALLREYASDSYNLDADALRRRMEQQELFAQWQIGRTAQEYEALLTMLRKYHDDAEEADRKAAERRKKIFDSSTQGMTLSNAGQQLDKQSGTEQQKWQRFQELNLVTGDVARDVEIDLYKQKIALSAQYIDSIREEMKAEKLKAQLAIDNAKAEVEALRMRGLDTANAEAELLLAKQKYASLERQEMLMTQEARQQQTEQTEHLNDLFMQSEQSKLTEIKKYTDAVVDFSSQMGEAAFGEVEDRKQAAKELIKSLLTTLKDWAAVKLTELAMKQMFAQQSTAIEGQQVVSDLTMQSAKTSADISMGTASATAKEAGKLGLKGLLVGAIISAALSALLSAAMSAFNKSKSTVQSVSGAGGGKLATGMLTYAEGNYPVLGNDGHVYNARYEGAGMSTGVYGGGAHYGIFSERKPEAVIDGDTTQKLVTDYRGLWNAILTISRHGSLPGGGMRTYATGNVSDLTRQLAQADAATAPQPDAQATQATLTALTQAMQRTNAVMEHLAAHGVNVNMWGEKGLYRQGKKGTKFGERVGL